MNREDYNRAFAQLIGSLNAQQRLAVERIDGAMLVVAGPGTGKTHLLAARIGQILIATDAQPHNILCLTFTDAGVQAMRQRLVRYIGPEAYRLHISTFHAFCNLVIQENADFFSKNDLEPISDLERIALIRRLIDELPETNVLRRLRGNPYQYEGSLKHLFSTMKTEAWTTEKVLKAIDTFVADLPNNSDYQYKRAQKQYAKGDPHPERIREATEKMQLLRAAALCADRYAQLLRDSGRYEFEDMLQWVHNAFAQHERVLRRYQEQYLYVLIDEYQDTNGIQNKIIEQLAAYWDRPNLFVVGDDDQAVYEFQGARLKNITDFIATYAHDLETVLLTDNYRSTQPILDAARSVIEHNQLRLSQQLALQKVLTAQSVHPAVLPEVVRYPNALHEEIDIVQQIIALRDGGTPLSEIAVIYVLHKQAARLMQLLSKHELPYQTKRPVNILESPLMAQLLTVLDVLAAEHRLPSSGETGLYELLHYPFTHIEYHDIARLSAYKVHRTRQPVAANADEPTPIYTTATAEIADFDLPLTWLELIADAQLHAALKLHNSAALLHLHGWLTDLLQNYRNLPLPVLLEQMLTRSGCIAWLDAQPDRIFGLQVLHSFTEFVAQESLRKANMSVADLRYTIQSLQDNKLAINVLATQFVADAVVLTTAHSAKGLEFDHVFIIDVTKNSWEGRTANTRNQFALPPGLTRSVGAPENALEGLRRLFYVAMTRAKKTLHISYGSATLSGDKAQEPSIFIAELSAESINSTERYMESDIITDFQRQLLTERAPVTVQPYLSTAELDVLLTDYALSASALNRFMRCPLSFYYQNVLKIGGSTSAALIYGNAVHAALRRAYDRLKKMKTPKFAPVATFIKDFEREMVRYQPLLSKPEYDNRIAFGKQKLPAFYEHGITKWSKKAQVERRLAGVVYQGIPLVGNIDKMDNISNYADIWRVTDFKTGKLTPKNKVVAPNEKQPFGSEVWRQLAFYKLLVEQYRGYGWIVEEAGVAYTEADDDGGFGHDLSIRFATTDMELLRQLLADTWTRITQHDFFTGCGKADCDWCNFTRRYQNAQTLGDDIEEVMDDE